MTPNPEKKSLSVERDERVVPFVKQLIGKLGSFPWQFASDDTEEATKQERESLATFVRDEFMVPAMTQKVRLADVGYSFKLAKLAIDMLKARSSNTSAETARDAIIVAAQEILAQLGNEPTLMLTEFDPAFANNQEKAGEERAKLYDGFYTNIVEPVLERHKIAYNEVSSVFEVMSTLVSNVETMAVNTIEDAKDLATRKIWNKEGTDITVEDIHRKAIEDEPEGVH